MLYFTKKIGSTLLGIWKIEEPRDILLEMLRHKEWLGDILSIKAENRILEKLAIRALLKNLLGEEKLIAYHSSGCPYLADGSWNVAISHTTGYAAVALNKQSGVGVDIERLSDRVRRVRPRLIRGDEYVDPNKEIEHLLLHFSAKESMFKLLESEGVGFLEHLRVKPFEVKDEGFFQMTETRSEKQSLFDVYYRVEQDFVLTCLAGDSYPK